MNKQTRAKVLAAALAVREWASKKNAPETLWGWCAICSGELWKRLQKEGIQSDIVVQESDNSCHVFLIVDGWVVDPTATQFGLRGHNGVTIIHEKESEVFDFYEPAQVFGTVEELVKYQMRTKWPKSQTAKI